MPVSRSRRDPKKTKKKDGASGDTPTGRSMPAHAHLRDADGHVVGGMALRDEEWVLVLRGTVVATTDSAGMAIAMLQHTRAALARHGGPVDLDYSATLRERATAEAEEVGKSLDDYLAYLETERAENAAKRQASRTGTLQ